MNSSRPLVPAPPGLGPTPHQRRWMDLRQGLFVHFGINTFHDTEWSDGSLPLESFAPTRFDPDAWCGRAAEAGLRLVLLVTKHHDGFCNWPTARTDYHCGRSPFRRDVLGEVAAAARRHGLEVAVYFSLWDRRHDDGDEAYADFAADQLTELLTGYGPLVEVWFDGMWIKINRSRVSGEEETAWKHGTEDHFLELWHTCARPRWQWDRLLALVRRHQPGAVVINNTTTHFPGVPAGPVDARPGEQATAPTADRKVWEQDGRAAYLPLQIETTLSRQGPGLFSGGSWFWHPWDHSCATVAEVRAWHAAARALEAVLLINVGPTAEGRLRPEDDALLRALAQERLFTSPPPQDVTS